jgi:hypothetical protein
MRGAIVLLFLLFTSCTVCDASMSSPFQPQSFSIHAGSSETLPFCIYNPVNRTNATILIDCPDLDIAAYAHLKPGANAFNLTVDATQAIPSEQLCNFSLANEDPILGPVPVTITVTE